MTKGLKTEISRRDLVQQLALLVGAVPLASMLACGATSEEPLGDEANGETDGAAGDGEAPDGAAANDQSAVAADAGSWATGGTKAMSGNYPDPFASGLGASCVLTCGATIGPCYAQTVERRDISEGQDGLPVRLAFWLVDEACKPVANATMDVWHCGPAGLYSGDDASDFCTSGDSAARSARWFRGIQTSDENGRVTFDTCFPGWYSSRTIHIHFTIRVNGTEMVTSQLVFDDALDDEIVATQALYATRGARDTHNTNDNVVGGADLASYTFSTQRTTDGAMLASKAIILRSSAAATLCSLGGGGSGPAGEGGFGGPGGPPPPGAAP